MTRTFRSRNRAEPRFVASTTEVQYFEFTDRGHFIDARQFPEIVSSA